MQPEDDNTQDQPQEAQPQRLFRVKVIQTQDVVVENFDYDDADNKKEALRRAQNFIDDEKDLEKGSYRLEVEEIEVPDTSDVVLGRDDTPSTAFATEGAESADQPSQ